MMRAMVILVILGAVYEVAPLPATNRKCTKVVDIAMVVDESGSVGRSDFSKVKTFLNDIISKFTVSPFGVHFGLVKYSSIARLVFSLTRYTDAEAMKKSIQDMKYRGGGTRTGKALEFTKNEVFNQELDRLSVPNVLIIFSDGKSHDQSRAKKTADEMKEKGVVVVCVAIGKYSVGAGLVRQLQELASKPEYVFKTSFNLLKTMEDGLVKEVCEAIDPCKAKPCRNNGVCVRTGDDTYKCQCPGNYEGPNCELPKWCPKASFTKQGCYRLPNRDDKTEDMHMLFSYRNVIDWHAGWDAYLEKVVCDCAGKAKEGNYKHFWIEFYGECWASANLDFGKLDYEPRLCWSKRPKYEQCMHQKENPICVGKASSGYLYKLEYQPNVTN